jgi:hypothetical protein
LPAIGGTVAISGTVKLASGVFAGIVSMTSGAPRPSVAIACLLPGRDRSTGLGPVCLKCGPGIGPVP